MSDEGNQEARLPPRWFVRLAWFIHRGLYRVTAGRFGLRRARADRYGMMRLTTTGRRTGQERSVILGYFEDGPNYITLAMNGWMDGEPAWWLNLQTNPEATVVAKGGKPQRIRAHAAEGEERDRLWARWQEIDEDTDRWAALRSTEAAVVVLEVIGAE